MSMISTIEIIDSVGLIFPSLLSYDSNLTLTSFAAAYNKAKKKNTTSLINKSLLTFYFLDIAQLTRGCQTCS